MLFGIGVCVNLKNIAIFGLCFLLISLLSTSYSGATAIGTSSISIAYANTSIYQGKSTSIPYVVKLASGSTWGTTLNVVDLSYLNYAGITVSLSTSYGEPTYTGSMSISISSSTIPGNYNITLNATGDDPSQNNAVLRLTVLKPANTTSSSTSTNSTTANTTVPKTNSSTATSSTPSAPPPSTLYPATGSSGGNAYVYLVIIIVIIAIIAAALVISKRH